MSDALFVELIGPAGAGKTTLIRALAASGTGIAVAPKPSLRAPRDLPYFLGHAAALWPLLVRKGPADRRLTKRERWWMLYLDGWDAELPRRVSGRPGIWLLDHGPIYMLTSLDEFGPPQTRSEACRRFRLEALRRWSSFLDLVVWLDAPNRILAERIEVRATDHRMKGEAEHEVHAFLDRYRAAFRRVVSAAPAPARKLRVLELATEEQTPAQLRERVLGEIAALRRNG